MATDALFTQTIIQWINQYIIQYDFLSIITIPPGISSAFTPGSITSLTKWLHAINNFDCLDNHQYSAWREFILRYETDVEIESNDWLKGTFLQWWNQICKVFLLITVVLSPCSASSSSI